MNCIARTRRIVTVIFAASVAMALNAPAALTVLQSRRSRPSRGDATIVRNGTSVAAKVGDPVFEKDTIETGADGAIGLTFVDNTVMSTGPNSEIAMDQYRFDSSNFNGAMLADMHKGTVTMVSGDIARSSPGAMKIRTPTAILGVRGTRFAIQVEGEPLIVRRVWPGHADIRYACRLLQPPGAVRGAAQSRRRLGSDYG